MYCTECGKRLKSGEKYCPFCGTLNYEEQTDIRLIQRVQQGEGVAFDEIYHRTYQEIWKFLVEDVKMEMDEADNQILVYFTDKVAGPRLDEALGVIVNDNYLEKRCAVIVPSDNDLGYTLKEINDSEFFSEEQLKEIAKELRVPEGEDVEYEQLSAANYWEGSDKYLVQVMITGENGQARALVDCKTGTPCRNVLTYTASATI